MDLDGADGVRALPLYITLETALLAGLEHGEDRWRNLLATPVSRWSLYFSKPAIPCAMTFLSSLVLTFGCVVDGLILRRLKPVRYVRRGAARARDPALSRVALLFIRGVGGLRRGRDRHRRDRHQLRDIRPVAAVAPPGAVGFDRPRRARARPRYSAIGAAIVTAFGASSSAAAKSASRIGAARDAPG